VQLTGKNNFRRMGDLVGVDLVGNPDLALKMDIAAKALISGIRDGIYTGKSASDYLPKDGPAAFVAYVNARRIINGTFEAAKYAHYALAFETALTAGGYQASRQVHPAPPVAPLRAPVAPRTPAAAPKGFIAWLLARIFPDSTKGGPA